MRRILGLIISLLWLPAASAGENYPSPLTTTAAYLQCLDAGRCVELPRFLGSPFSSCVHPFVGMCHKYSVGHNYDLAGNIHTPWNEGQSIVFYRCGGMGESCEDVCANATYDGATQNGGNFRRATSCAAWTADAMTMRPYSGIRQYWAVSPAIAAP